MRKVISLFLMLFILDVKASTLLIPDSDTAALIQLVSLTASQLNELERLVTNTEKYTKKMQEYNEIVQDKIYIAERIQMWADDMIYLSKNNPEDLGALNDAIRDLKSSKESISYLIKEVYRDKRESEKSEDQADVNAIALKRNTRKNETQALRRGVMLKDSTQKIAQNTGITAVEVSRSNEIQNAQLREQSKISKNMSSDMKLRLLKEKERDDFYQLNRKKIGLLN